MLLKPSDIYYSQDSIRSTFGDSTIHSRKRIGETLDDIINGKCQVSQIPVIKVTHTRGKWYTSNNRRLWVFKQLQRLGKCEQIPARRCRRLPRNKFTTKNEGVDIQVRGLGPGGEWYMRLYPSSDLQTRTLEDTLCTTKSSDKQLRAPNCNVSEPSENHTGIELARPYQIGNEFKTDNSLYEKENFKSNVTESQRSDVKFKYADFLNTESQQAIGGLDRAHDTRSPSVLAMQNTNLEINETKGHRSCIMQAGIVREAKQSITFNYERKQTDFAFEKEISSRSSHELKSSKTATFHNTKTDIDNDEPDRKYLAKKTQGQCHDILADNDFVPPEKPIINNPSKSENNSHATFEYLRATNTASSQARGPRNTLNKPNVKAKYIATEPTDFAVYTRACNAKTIVVDSEKRSSARLLKTSDFKDVSTQGKTNSNNSTHINFEHVNKSVTNKPEQAEQVYESKPRMTSTLEGNIRTARPFPANVEETTVANTNKQIDEIPLKASTEKVRNRSGKNLKAPYPTVLKDSVAAGFTTKSTCSSHIDKKHSTDILEYPARDEAVFRRPTSLTQNIPKPIASGSNARTESAEFRDLRGVGQMAVSETRHITSSATREERKAISASKHKHSIPDKADTSGSLTSAQTINIYQEKAHK
ncbi:uncharacterized protein LOC127873790 [Dreissena polymorpha]|nr:uncharacterized protein LOC127873790 [Dreissena polymorpha]